MARLYMPYWFHLMCFMCHGENCNLRESKKNNYPLWASEIMKTPLICEGTQFCNLLVEQKLFYIIRAPEYKLGI